MKNVVKTLKTRRINEEDFKYIEYNQGGIFYDSDYYVELRVNEEFKETLKSIGGMTYEMLIKPIEDNKDVVVLKVMTYLVEGMELLMVVKHVNSEGKVLSYKYTTSFMYLYYIKGFVSEREKFIIKEDTTYKYLNDEHFLKLGVSVYEPKTAEDIGYSLNGKVLEFKREYELGRLDNIPKEELNEGAVDVYIEIYKRYNISKAILKTSEIEGAMGDVGEILYIKEDGKPLNCMEKTHIDYILENKEEITYEDIVKKEIGYEEEYTAYMINETLDRRRKWNEESTLQELADDIYLSRKKGLEQRIQSNVYEYIDEEYTELISRGYLKYLVRKGYIK